MTLDLELVFRHTSDAILGVDPEWKITHFNTRAEALLIGTTPLERGVPLSSCIADLAGSPSEEALRAVALGHVERRIEHFSPSRYTWFELRAVPSQGGLVVFLRDVTDRIRQSRTEAVQEAVRRIVMDAPIAITVTRGKDHRYELVNAMARALIGGRDIEGKTVRDAFPELDASLFELLDRVYASGTPYTAKDLEVTFDRDGSGTMVTATFDITYQPLFEADGSISGILTVSVETTDFAEARRRLESSAG